MDRAIHLNSRRIITTISNSARWPLKVTSSTIFAGLGQRIRPHGNLMPMSSAGRHPLLSFLRLRSIQQKRAGPASISWSISSLRREWIFQKKQAGFSTKTITPCHSALT